MRRYLAVYMSSIFAIQMATCPELTKIMESDSERTTFRLRLLTLLTLTFASSFSSTGCPHPPHPHFCAIVYIHRLCGILSLGIITYIMTPHTAVHGGRNAAAERIMMTVICAGLSAGVTKIKQ